MSNHSLQMALIHMPTTLCQAPGDAHCECMYQNVIITTTSSPNQYLKHCREIEYLLHVPPRVNIQPRRDCVLPSYSNCFVTKMWPDEQEPEIYLSNLEMDILQKFNGCLARIQVTFPSNGTLDRFDIIFFTRTKLKRSHQQSSDQIWPTRYPDRPTSRRKLVFENC